MNRISLTDGGALTGHAEPWSQALKLGPSLYRVCLGGAFSGPWLASLSWRLAEYQLSIDHLHARLGADGIWNAELHLLAFPGARDPLTIDYPALAARLTPVEVAPFSLDTHRLLESRDYGGSLLLTFEARDSLGLLGSLLHALAELDLFPVELHVETRAGQAYDCLGLVASAGAPPSAAARDAAMTLLARRTRAPA